MKVSAQATRDWQYETGQPATKSREQWKMVTAGDELARGKSVQFFPAPDYHLTNDENDAYDLTDGTLSSRLDDRVWFNKDAVGWMSNAAGTNGALMVIDLGMTQPIKQIAIRVLGGLEQDVLELPTMIEFMASMDGKQYFSLQKMVKLAAGEQEQSDFKTGFYIPEEGQSFMAPLVCRENVQARYIAIRMSAPQGLFTDQISILKADNSVPLKTLETFPEVQIYPDGAQVFFDGLAITPRYSPFTVTTNITTPNWLVVQDNSRLDLSKDKAEFRVELPSGLHILKQSMPAFKKIASDQPDINTYLFSYDGKNRNGSIGPIWIEREDGVNIPDNAKIVLTGILNGKDSHTVTYPINLVEIPEVPKIDGLDISLAWMVEAYQHQWPHYLRDFRKMGFGGVATFPRAYARDEKGNWNTHTQKSLAFLQQAREVGYGVVYNESPFHIMWNAIQDDIKAGKLDEAEAEQLFTQVDGKRGKNINILYRGKYFQDEIKRVATAAAQVQPDLVFLDIELWGAHVNASRKDPRVIAVWEKSGKSWEDFATDNGTEVLRTLVTAIRQAVPEKKLLIGLYGSDPKNVIYTNYFEWKKLYPEIIDIAQPSLYIQGRAQVVADRVRYDYDTMQTRQIIPWLSAGTYGEFNPKLMEPMVLETILNGARGLTYYWFGDFDPMDFYYHSKALAELAPHQKLLQHGKPIDYKGDNPDLHYTAFASDNEALVLIENYNNASDGNVKLSLPISSTTKVLLDGKALPISNDTISINVPAGEFRLIYLEK